MSQYTAEFLLNSIFNKLCVLITIWLGHAFCQDKIVSQTVKKGQKGRMLKKTSWIYTKEKLSTSSEATSDQTD